VMRGQSFNAILAIVAKDMRTYYLKAPAISWGIVFPVTWILAFYLRHPSGFAELIPGLIAMTALFSTTAAEAVVINFELRLGALERLLLAPVRFSMVFLAKVLAGALFGLLMSAVVTFGVVLAMSIPVNIAQLFLIVILSLVSFAGLGAFLCVLVTEVFDAQTLLNFPRFVMIFLSGVVYPVSALPAPLQVFARFFPLTYTVEGLRSAFFAPQWNIVSLDLLALLGFTLFFLVLGMRRFSRRFE
jgi:ABC-2 type transport system permease protein